MKKLTLTTFLLFMLFSFPLLLLAQVQLGNNINGEAPDDRSGYSVSMSSDGSIVAIGAHKNDGGGADAGHVRIYQYNSGSNSWAQLGNDIDGEAADDWSGFNISLSSDGSRVAIGAFYNDGGGSDAGHVRIYQYNSGSNSWAQLGNDINGEATGDQSGISVSLSSDGSRVAIGANKNNGGASNSGHVRIYEYNSGSNSWAQLGNDIDGEAYEDWSGRSVSLSSDGSIVAIGAIKNNNGGGTYAGHVRIYQYNSGSNSWAQLGSDIDGESTYDFSGFSVSLSSDGSRVAIGAYGNSGGGSSSGHVRVYQYNSGSNSWIQLGNDINGEAAGDWLGYSVSLSSDGSIVAIGASGNDGGGTDAGHVRIYQYNSGSNSWTQLGNDIDGEAAYDNLGYSVSLSSDGSIVAIGASGNDGGGTDAGHVRVYDISPSALPVSLTYFQGRAIAEGSVLTWQTASESNNRGFEIERSTDGEKWEYLGFVEGHGTTGEAHPDSYRDYQFTDQQPNDGINYYRLKQIDFDGAFEYSNILSIEYQISNSDSYRNKLRIFPNPATDQLNILNVEGEATIFNILGQPLKQFSIVGLQFSMNISDLSKGQYILHIQPKNEKIIIKRFVKN